MKSVYSAVRTGSLNTAVCASSVKVNCDETIWSPDSFLDLLECDLLNRADVDTVSSRTCLTLSSEADRMLLIGSVYETVLIDPTRSCNLLRDTGPLELQLLMRFTAII